MIDAIITPVNFFPAMPLNFSRDLTAASTSTLLQNILDCSACSFGPITHVREKECHYVDIGLNSADSMTRKTHEYMQGSTGLPINIQIFAKPYEDEIVLRLMKELEMHLKDKKK